MAHVSGQIPYKGLRLLLNHLISFAVDTALREQTGQCMAPATIQIADFTKQGSYWMRSDGSVQSNNGERGQTWNLTSVSEEEDDGISNTPGK
jgi:hypothetical protein